jgi:hypothetical protein
MTPNWKHYSNSNRYFDSQHYVFNEEAAGTNKNRVLTGATGLYTVFGPVYISINKNCKTPSMILIKSTLKMFICNTILCICLYLYLSSSFFHACQYTIYIIVTDMEGNIRIYRLNKVHGTEQ